MMTDPGDRQMMDPMSRKIISGQLREHDIPEIPAKVVRVFLSSTGEDTVTERNAIVENVYPRLRDYCRNRYGVEFQLVDLDWGLPPQESAFDPTISDFKLREIQRCQTLSNGPCFIALLGQRYGHKSLQSAIPVDEYDKLRMALHNHKSRDTRNAPLLDDWYIRDDNSIHPVYVLREASTQIQELREENGRKYEEGLKIWREKEAEMRRLLQRAATFCYLEGLIDLETKQKYAMSAADTQLMHGTEEMQFPGKKCIMVLRQIVDIKNYVNDPKAAKFIDIYYNEKLEQHEIDPSASHMLTEMLDRSKRVVTDDNVMSYEVLWRYDDVISPTLHKDYLDKLCSQLYSKLKLQIDSSYPHTHSHCVSDVFEESLHHWLKCKHIVKDFCGKEEDYGKLTNYLEGTVNEPMVIHGRSGSGKTTLLAKMATEVQDILPNEVINILRFVGHTPKSKDIKQIITGVCYQVLSSLYRDVSTIPHEFKDLQKFFHSLIQSIPSNITLVLFLDALDHLGPDHNAHLMTWMPQALSENVKIVLTLQSGDNPIYEQLKRSLLNNPSTSLEMTNVSLGEARQIFEFSLSKYGRKLSSLQMSVLQGAFQKCSLPLFVSLSAERAKSVLSTDSINEADFSSSVSDIMNNVFAHLEEKHGKEVFSRAMAYLVASKTGLSDCEMEDLLSLDEEVLNSIYIDFHPPVRRVPFSKWLRIKDDIGRFLLQKETDGVTISCWKHEEFNNVVRERYLSNSATAKEIHSMIADYFLGTWAGKAKPISGTDDTMAKIGKDRQVPKQPLTFESEDGPVRFNRRKYDQVPRHLYNAERLEELNKLVLFNYEWLYNKIKALSLQHIMTDFVLNPSVEASLVEEALRVSETVIEKDINNLAPELAGHLLPYYKTLPNIRALVHQCDTAGLKQCVLIPNFPYLQIPGSSLQFTLDTEAKMEYFQLISDDKYIIAKQRDSAYIHVFDLTVGEKKQSIFASNGSLYVTPNGRYFVIIDHITEKAVKVHNAETGAYIGQLIVLNHIDLKPKEKYKLGNVALTNEKMCAIVTTDVSYLCIANIETCQFLQIVGLDGRCDVCGITPKGDYVFCNSNEFLMAYDLFTLEHLTTFSIGYRPNTLTFSKDGLRAYMSNSKETKLMVLHLHGGVVEMAYKSVLESDMPDDVICDLRVSPNDDMILIRGKNHILVYNRFNEKVIASFARPADVPREFKLPKSHYIDLFYTNAEITRDGKYVVGTMFRNIYLWQISSRNLVTTVQAPVGIIDNLSVSKRRSQIITHIKDSKEIQVWNIDDAVNKVNMLDKLSGAIKDIHVTKDSSVAYAICEESDEIGVIDMKNGFMIDLLTHESYVKDFAVTPNGSHLLASLEPKKKDMAIKVWDMNERKVIKEFGNASGFCISPHENSYILFVSQKELSYEAPFFVNMFRFSGSECQEFTHPLALRYVLEKPFLTTNDKFLVTLTAQNYIQSRAVYEAPTICTFSMEDDMKVTYFTPESFKGTISIDTIVDLKPCTENPYTIAMMYRSKDLVDINDNNPIAGLGGSRYGFLILDVCSGSVNTVCDPFLAPNIQLDAKLIFSADFSICLDSQSRIFDVVEGCYTSQITAVDVPPKMIALNGTIAIYFDESLIFAVRIKDERLIAKCNVHANVCMIKLCPDDRTLIVGCQDGTIASYVLIDPEVDDADDVLMTVGSRLAPDSDEEVDGRMSRSWDKVDDGGSAPQSRPTSALSVSSKDKIILKKVKPAPIVRPNSDTYMYLNSRSKSCSVM